MSDQPRLALVPRLSSTSGPASFQKRLGAELLHRGLAVDLGLNAGFYDAILVVGGTRRLGELWNLKRRGVRIVQRLDGINWLHRKRWTGTRHFVRAEYGNLNLRWIRNRIADAVVYQSEFAKSWWHQRYGPATVPETVIYNAVDLDLFNPAGEHDRPDEQFRVLLVEGSLMGGYELGLEHAWSLMSRLQRIANGPVELQVVGRVTETTQRRFSKKADFPVRWTGEVDRSQIPALDRSAHALFSADLNPACPNTVIEALACGLPVLALDTGALPELVTPGAGRIAPYGGDPWQLEPPDMAALSESAMEVYSSQAKYRAGARARAEAAFDIRDMATRYLAVLGS